MPIAPRDDSLLDSQDYTKILTYYKIRVPRSRKTLKKRAEDILSTKLCRCIKKVDKKDEARGIGICTRSIFNKKGLTRGDFTCKKGTRRIDVRKLSRKNKATLRGRATKKTRTQRVRK